jgi:GNAT superfamily N-acetyltransferase
MNSEYRLDRVSATNIHDLLPIFKSAFGAEPDLHALRVKFDTSVFGKYTIGFIAYHIATGAPAAYYGIFPIRVKIGGRIVLAAQSGDTMTHKDHQGKGLFTGLAKQTYETAKEEGVAFVFGFPNQNSAPGFFRKLNWKPLPRFELYKIRIQTLPVSALASKSSLLQKVYDLILPSVIPNFENSAIDAGYDGVIHDADFWTYKSSISKLFKIESSQISFAGKVSRNLYVGDAYTDLNNLNELSLSSLSQFAAFMGCFTIFAFTSPDSPFSQLLRSKYEPKEGLEIGYLPLAEEDFDASNLRFNLADSDTF